MNFTWLNKQGVRSDTGFEVQRIDRFTTEYREGERTITVYTEPAKIFDSYGVSINSDAFLRWDPDSGGEQLTPQRQREVLNNFREALVFKGLKLYVDYGNEDGNDIMSLPINENGFRYRYTKFDRDGKADDGGNDVKNFRLEEEEDKGPGVVE